MRSRFRTHLAAFIVLLPCLLLLAGCGSTLKETYYLKAYDPAERKTNFFRIRIEGQTTSSRTKFSVGFFDRSAVERLFGENLLSRQYLASDIKLFDDKGSYNTNLETQLQSARTADDVAYREELKWIAATLNERIGQMQVRLASSHRDSPELTTKLDQAALAVSEATTKLSSTTPADGDLILARNSLFRALGIVRAIRLAVDGQVIVRFLDGAGNEVDVSNQVQLIFVSTDAGRFTQALRDLVQSDKTRQELLQVVLGPKIIEADKLRAELAVSSAALQSRLATLVARNTEVQAATTVPQAAALVLRSANEAAGAVSFKDADSIRIYVEGI